MLKKQLEEGKVATDGASGGLVAIPPPGGPGAAAAAAAAASAAALVQQLQPNQPNVEAPTSGQIGGGPPPPYNVMAPTDGNALAMQQPVHAFGNPTVQMINGDSHAVLMELFARDQGLVRQAMEGAKLKAQAAALGLDATVAAKNEQGAAADAAVAVADAKEG